jgi:hypothetical protein
MVFLEELVLRSMRNIDDKDIENVNSVTSFVFLAVKIIERAHKKKKLSYEDSQKLVDVVLDIMIRVTDKTNVPEPVRNTLDYVKDNRYIIRLLIAEMIGVWDFLSKNRCLFFRCTKKRIRKSIPERHVDVQGHQYQYSEI